MKIRDRLYLVSGGIYGQLGNVWMVSHSQGCVLFDCGAPASYETIIENLRYWGFSPEDVTHVFCTHGHDDHAGTAALLQKDGAKIVVGAADAYMLETGCLGENTPFLNHVMEKCTPDILIENDTVMEIGDISVHIYTMPGHTDGTLVYDVHAENENYLFTGDMFCCEGEKGDIARTWWKGDMDYSPEKLGESFRKLWSLNLEPYVIGGGHGNPRIGKDAKDMIMIAYKYYLLNDR